jgi:hypothetical protein
MSAKDYLFSRIKQLLLHCDDPALTTTALTAAAAKGATSLTVASATGIVDAQTIRIGSGETAEWNKVSGAPSGSTVTLAYPLGQSHLVGEDVRSGITYDFGDPTGGVKVSINTAGTDIPVDTKRTVFAILHATTDAFVEGAWPTFTLPQLARALGMLASRVTGAGSTASPYQLIIDGSQLGEDVNIGVLVTGLLENGTDWFVELHGCDMDYTAVTATLKQGTLSSIPFKAFAASQVVLGTTAPSYTVNSTKRPTKAKVFNLPTEFGYFGTGGTGNTALTADAAAGATAFVLADTTGFAPGDRVKLGTGDAEEVHFVLAVADGTHFTTRTPTRYAHLTGETAVEQVQTVFAGVTDDGLVVTVGGSLREVPFAARRFKGRMPGAATLAMSFSMSDLRLANVAYALGAPQADVSGGRLVIKDNVGTAELTAAYMRGTNLGGNTIEVNAFGSSQDLSTMMQSLGIGDIAKLPVALRPNTIQFLQY